MISRKISPGRRCSEELSLADMAFFDSDTVANLPSRAIPVKNEVDQEFSRNSGGDENIYDWIRRLYRDSRGVELPGTVNPAVLENMFRQQSAPWNQLALEYYNSVRAAITAFNDGVFGLIVPDEELRGTSGLVSNDLKHQLSNAPRNT